MIYDDQVYKKLQTIDKVLHLLLEDPVVQERFKEVATFEKLGGEVEDVTNLTALMYQALNDVSGYIDGNRYSISNFHMYMKEFMQLQHDHAFGFCNGSEYQSRIDQIKMDIDNLYFT